MKLVVDIDIPYAFDVPEVRQQIREEVKWHLEVPLSVTTGPAEIKNVKILLEVQNAKN